MEVKKTEENANDWQVITHLSFIYRWIISNLSDFVSGESLQYKVSFDQFLIMHGIANEEHLTGSKLARNMSVSRSAISRQCRLLKENGYITEAHLDSDQRVKYLSLTPEGERVMQILVERYIERYREIVERIGHDKIEGFINFVDEFYQDVIEDSTYEDNKMGRQFLQRVQELEAK